MARTITGIVSSDKTDKTIVVTVQADKTHPIYKKKYSFSRKFMAHDAKNDAKIGDKVVISETRPLSARKRYTLDRVVERAGVKHEEPELEIEKADKPETKVSKPKPKAEKPKVIKEESK
jgi:small subunit ribosomal protein S17